MAKQCSIVDCNNKHYAKGFCRRHNRYNDRYGSPHIEPHSKYSDPKKALQARTVRRASGCLEWTGHTCSGYGRMTIKGKKILAHRFSYETHIAPIPDNHIVCHTCDNPKCCAPEHLFLGTHKDNTADMINKGRQAVGTDKPQAKLNDSKVRKIRILYTTGKWTQRALAKKYMVSQRLIFKVVHNKVWRHA